MSRYLLKWQNLWRQVELAARAETGASIILFTLCLAMLLGFAGLVVDGSNVYFNDQKMQIAADAAALAGARILSQNATKAEVAAEIQQLALANGADSATWSYINNNRGVHVVATHHLDAYFAPIYGYNDFTVSAEAAAQYESVTSAGDLLPFTVVCNHLEADEDDEEDDKDKDKDKDKDSEEGIDCANGAGFVYDVEYILHEPEASAAGNFGWVRWEGDNPNTPDLEYNINHPEDSPVLQIGDLIEGTTGMKSSVFPTLDQWLGKPVTVPIYDQVTGTGSNTKYRIYAFAVFELTSYDKQDKTISGRFVRTLVRSDENVENGVDYGARDVRFVQ